MEEIKIEEVEFDEALYQKNLQENTFPERDELDGIGVGDDANN